MKYLIFDNQIAGTYQQGVTVPQGFRVVEGVPGNPEEIYFNPDADRVEQKPPAPSDRHQWNDIKKKYQEPVVPPPPGEMTPQSPWERLTVALEDTKSPLRAKIGAAATTFSQPGMVANLAFTTILTIVASTHNSDRLLGEIANLRTAMSQIPAVGDFTQAEIAAFNDMLAAFGFSETVRVPQ